MNADFQSQGWHLTEEWRWPGLLTSGDVSDLHISLISSLSIQGFPDGLVVKNPPAVQKTQDMWVQSLGGKIPWSRKWQSTAVFLLEKFHSQRSLVGYSPKSLEELHTTKQLSMSTHLSIYCHHYDHHLLSISIYLPICQSIIIIISNWKITIYLFIIIIMIIVYYLSIIHSSNLSQVNNIFSQ